MDIEIREYRIADRIYLSAETIADTSRNSYSGVGMHSVSWTLRRWPPGREPEAYDVPANQGYILELPDLPADRRDVSVAVQPMSPLPGRRACTEEPLRDVHVVRLR